MTKVAILVLADTETHGDLGRVTNALMAAREFKEGGDEIQLIFDGAGTQWPGVLSDPNHRGHGLFEQVHDVITGACGSCSRAFHAEEGLQHAHVKPMEEYHGHPSIRDLVVSGHQVITF